MRKIISYLAFLAGFLMLNAAHAADDIATIKAGIEAIKSDPERYQVVIEKGREAADFCQLCHGQDGNADKPGVPNLAQQNPVYLTDQFNKFANGEREDFTGVMQSLVNTLEPEDRMALAMYFAGTRLKALPYDSVKAEAGKAHFQRVCSICHGADGLGKEGYARIAGQRQDYVVDTLKMFRDKDIGKWRNRESSMMTAYVTGMDDQTLEQLAHYITSLGEGIIAD
jgi:cbb3-type cytochrome c oxidase subunit III